MTEICGQISFDWSEPPGPDAWLASRLARQLVHGSPECALIWKQKTTTSNASLYALQPSRRRTSDSVSTGAQSTWSTPPVVDQERSDETLNRLVSIRNKRAGQLSVPLYLGDAMRRLSTTWPTPTVADIEGGRKTRSRARNDEMLLNGLMSTWATPMATDGSNGGPNMSFSAGGTPLPTQMAHSGPAPSGSNAPTEKRGAPNPEFACWLMGWPDALTFGVLQAIQSYRSLPRKSSKRSKTKLIPDERPAILLSDGDLFD